MSTAIIGTGVLLAREDTPGGGTFTDISEIRTLKPPSYSRNEVDVSSHNLGIEEKILGMLRQGQATGTMSWVPTDATHADTGTGVMADIINNVKSNWRITLPSNPPDDKKVMTFPARIQMLDFSDITTDSPMEFNFALTLDGQIIFSTVPNP